jgi:hypothetical protein
MTKEHPVMATQNTVACIVALLLCVGAAEASVHIASDAERADPISGLRWQRVADPKRPAAPPRLTLMRGLDTITEHRELRQPAVCVRAGDHVSLRASNAGFSSFFLEGMALENGVCGARVRVRVMVTGALLEMTVLDSGSGMLSGKADGWR